MERNPQKDPSINALALTIFTINIGGGIIIAIISLYTYHLGISLTLGGLVISLYAITRGISQPIIGHFIDRMDPRPVIIVGITLFIIAFAAPSIPSAIILFIARAFQGIASGIVTVACFTIIARRYFVAHSRRMANARFMALEMIGAILGPVVGSAVFWISGSFSSPFIVCSMFGVIALALFIQRKDEIGGEKPIEHIHGEEKRRKKITFAPYGLSILFLIASMNFVVMFVWGSLMFIMPLFAVSIGMQDYSVGYFFGALSFGMIFTVWLAQRNFFGKIPIEFLIVAGSGFALVSLTILIFVTDFWSWILLFWAMGAGVGTLFPILPTMAADAILDRPGQGVSYLEMGGNVGFILGPIISGRLAEGCEFARAFQFEIAASYLLLTIAIILVFIRRKAMAQKNA